MRSLRPCCGCAGAAPDSSPESSATSHDRSSFATADSPKHGESDLPKAGTPWATRSLARTAGLVLSVIDAARVAFSIKYSFGSDMERPQVNGLAAMDRCAWIPVGPSNPRCTVTHIAVSRRGDERLRRIPKAPADHKSAARARIPQPADTHRLVVHGPSNAANDSVVQGWSRVASELGQARLTRSGIEYRFQIEQSVANRHRSSVVVTGRHTLNGGPADS